MTLFRWRPIPNFQPSLASESGAQTATCSPVQPGIAPNPQNRNSNESAGSWNLDSVAGGGNGSRGYLICHGDPLAGSCPPRLNIKGLHLHDPTLQPNYYLAQYSAAMAYAIAARDDSA